MNKPGHKNNNRGFSLVEAMISVLVMSVTASALFATLGSTKAIQTKARRVNTISKAGAKFMENLREVNYLTLSEALDAGTYDFDDFYQYRNDQGQYISLMDSSSLYEMKYTCERFRVDENITVEHNGDLMRIHLSFVDNTSQEPEEVVQMVSAISENGINFK